LNRRLEPWPTDGSLVLTVQDYIYSMLVETPNMYFRVPGSNYLYIYVIGVGMVLIRHDFRGMTEEEIQQFIHHVRKTL
jgi:hypothetical protein